MEPELQQNRVFTREEVVARYRLVRAKTEALVAPLAVEDTVVQPMPDVSPPKWHLAHTTWFFEHFCLDELQQGYQRHHPQYGYLFNSYYDAVGARTPRPNRGFMTRPTLAEVMDFRRAVDAAMVEWLMACPQAQWPELAERTILGTHHEQQHQELLLTDIKYILHVNPLAPVYAMQAVPESEAAALDWVGFSGGLFELGHPADQGFAYDNECPRHRVQLAPFEIANRLVTNGEYLAFVEAGGYRSPVYWLSEGWGTVQAEGWQAPLYWFERDGRWYEYTLHGVRLLDTMAPVTHVSYYEADAYAMWKGCRLPTEAEWELAAAAQPLAGLFVDTGVYQPVARTDGNWFGSVWQWTGSAYLSYPGYRREPTAFGEYNGKWMVNQQVLRGGSVATPSDHYRKTYRNFFHADKRWQFTGIRLAR